MTRERLPIHRMESTLGGRGWAGRTDAASFRAPGDLTETPLCHYRSSSTEKWADSASVKRIRPPIVLSRSFTKVKPSP